ncbi:DUF6518 family protein [Neobacillus vireti]|uniref:DUF6518 family protein n=1 Tax=Neobacillus vireti TaxID=220686 RepID=UPI002FFF57AA
MKLWNGVFISFFIGIIVGILTVLGQGVLPGSWNLLANSRVSWLLPSFFIGAMGSTKTKSASFSMISLLGMFIGYYGYAMQIQNVPHSLYFILIWTGAAIVGGTIFGIAGFLWRRDNGVKHKFGSALIGGVFISEGLDKFIHINDYRHMLNVGLVQIVIGFTLFLVLERTNKGRIFSLIMALPILILGIIGFQILHFLT